MEVFSTIASHVFSGLVITLQGSVTGLPEEVVLFETLCKMYEARPYKLAFWFKFSRFRHLEAQWELE